MAGRHCARPLVLPGSWTEGPDLASLCRAEGYNSFLQK